MLIAAFFHVLLATQGFNPSPEDDPAALAAPQDELAAAQAESDEEGDDGEAEDKTPPAVAPGIRYSADLTDEQLRRLWREAPELLGTISVGFADRGRVINAVHMPKDAAWMCQRPDLAWGTKETVDGLAAAFRAVRAQFPSSGPARLSHIGAKEGGWLRPHRSHQSGRDADVAFFYRNDRLVFHGRRDNAMDPARNWALLKSLVTLADVQVILVDRGIQKVLRDYALGAGEDQAWVDRLFHGGAHALVQHAKHHKDHFHVRFFAPRSQELGRRIQPLLALRPEQNLALHRVKRGQTLARIARLYGTTVPAIRKANRLRRASLHLNQRLLIPLRKPCTHCPLPPPLVVPPRLLPPQATLAAATDDSALLIP